MIIWFRVSDIVSYYYWLILPLLRDLVLPFHFLLFKLTNVPHTDLLAELKEHFVLHLKKKRRPGIRIKASHACYVLFFWTQKRGSLAPGSCGLSAPSCLSPVIGWSSWCRWYGVQSWPARSLAWIFPEIILFFNASVSNTPRAPRYTR